MYEDYLVFNEPCVLENQKKKFVISFGKVQKVKLSSIRYRGLISCWCSNAEKLLKYDRKQLILSHMYSPSEMCFECRRCSMKNLFLKTHSLIEKCTKIISYLIDNMS